jgi:glycerol-3-phosphate acyltransferase PlsY
MAFVVRISSLSALTAAVVTPVCGWWLDLPLPQNGVILLMVLLLVWRHRSNIQKLLTGAEDKIGADRPEG